MVWAIIIGTALILFSSLLSFSKLWLMTESRHSQMHLKSTAKWLCPMRFGFAAFWPLWTRFCWSLRRDFAENPKLTHTGLILRLDELRIDSELNPRISFVNALGEEVLTSTRGNSG
jgi:hypothetical protein